MFSEAEIRAELREMGYEAFTPSELADLRRGTVTLFSKMVTVYLGMGVTVDLVLGRVTVGQCLVARVVCGLL